MEFYPQRALFTYIALKKIKKSLPTYSIIFSNVTRNKDKFKASLVARWPGPTDMEGPATIPCLPGAPTGNRLTPDVR